MIEAYPLYWPIGYKRTEPHLRIASKFQQNMERAQNFLHEEIARLGGRELIVSTDIPVRNDGKLYADWMKRRIDDPGVAIYFKYKGKDISMCCDQHVKVWENLYALAKGIEALRGMARWGVSDFIDRAFTGFAALEETSSYNQKSQWQILGLSAKPASVEIVHAAFKAQSKKMHPDVLGGSTEAFQQLTKAYKQILKQY